MSQALDLVASEFEPSRPLDPGTFSAPAKSCTHTQQLRPSGSKNDAAVPIATPAGTGEPNVSDAALFASMQPQNLARIAATMFESGTLGDTGRALHELSLEKMGITSLVGFETGSPVRSRTSWQRDNSFYMSLPPRKEIGDVGAVENRSVDFGEKFLTSRGKRSVQVLAREG